MFFLFFYYITTIFISNFTKKYYVSNYIKKFYFFITKVMNIFFIFLANIKLMPKIIIKITIWLLFSAIVIFAVIKVNLCISSFVNYVFNFKIKYQLFVFYENNFDPYSILKVADFILFYPIFYIYFYFFNDLNFSFQRAYYWIIYKINNFGLPQNKRSNFMKNWSFGHRRFQPKRRYDYHAYHSTINLFKKSWKSAVGKVPYIINYPYYLFFIFIVCFLIYLIYRVYIKDLKPIRYDMDDSIRFDFFGSISDQTLRFEFHEYFVEKIEDRIFKINRYPLDYLYNKDNNLHNIEDDEFFEEKNSFDLIMNKFGIDGLSYLDELRSREKLPNNFSLFSYSTFIIYFFKDILENLFVFIKYQYKFNLIFKVDKRIFIFKSVNNLYLDKFTDKLFYFLFYCYFTIFYVYFFIILIIFLFLLLDSAFLTLFLSFYSNSFVFDFKNLLVFL